MPNPGDALEEHVQSVFRTLLNLRDEGIVVSARTRLRGRSGVYHQVDVYYEFRRAGITHRVAIECKDTGRPVEKGDLLEFHSKLSDLPNVVGVFVARSGFQEGFREYAEHYGIIYMTVDELPNIAQLIADKLAAVALPDETTIGEPFWCLMELDGNQVTGSHLGIPDPSGRDRRTIPLFYSRRHAEIFHRVQELGKRYGVRGLPQYALRAALITGHALGAQFLVMWGHQPDDEKGWAGRALEPADVAAEYYNGAVDFTKVSKLAP